MTGGQPSLARVRRALEASWSADTAYRGATRDGVPSLGQCYPTSRVLQLLFPELEVVEGVVWTGTAAEMHFWNLLVAGGRQHHLDLTWQQFPAGTQVREWRVRDRGGLGDGPETLARVDLLLERVRAHLAGRGAPGS